MEEIWRSRVAWDEPIKDEQLAKWNKWLYYLPELEKIKIERCYLKSFTDFTDTQTQLHMFVDASENGNSAAT